jgi:hypothetical protein
VGGGTTREGQWRMLLVRPLQRVCTASALGSCVHVHGEDGARNLQLIEPAWPRPAVSQGLQRAGRIYILGVAVSILLESPSLPFFHEPRRPKNAVSLART